MKKSELKRALKLAQIYGERGWQEAQTWAQKCERVQAEATTRVKSMESMCSRLTEESGALALRLKNAEIKNGELAGQLANLKGAKHDVVKVQHDDGEETLVPLMREECKRLNAEHGWPVPKPIGGVTSWVDPDTGQAKPLPGWEERAPVKFHL